MWQLAEKVLRKSRAFRVDSPQPSGAANEEIVRTTPRVTSYGGHADDVLECSIAYNRYGGYCVPLASQHRPVPQAILEGEVWEPLTVEFLMSHCGTGDVVHAGTYFGDFLPPLSRSVAPTAKIWAFEPHPENYRCARITMQLNGLDNIVLANAGLGDEHGSFAMRTVDRESGRALGGASRIVTDTSGNRTEKLTQVDVVTIDASVPADRPISIIQLDVEGFQHRALLGAMATIRRWRPLLIVEKPPEETWLADHLFPLGYRVIAPLHDNMVLSTRDVSVPT